jgi:type I restriction enzyme S subunit
VPSPSEDVWGVLKTTSIQAGAFQPEHNKLLPRGLEPRPLIEVKEGDILITCAGPRVRCGVSCLVRQTRKRLMMSGKMYRFRVDTDRTDSRYVEAFLQTEQARLAIDKIKTGSSDSGLNLTHDRFRQLRIPVAPLPEQRRIVAEIEKQFTRLEAGVAALRRVQANLKRYRAAVLKAACEGHLVPTEAELFCSQRSTKNSQPAYETGEDLLARILTERRQNWQGRGKYKEPAAPDTAGLPPLPAAWAWATVEQLAAPEPNSITDGPFGSNLKTEHYMDNGPRVIRLQNIGDGVYVDEEAHISQAHFERLQKHRVFANDVVIAGFGENPPRSCIIPEALGPAIVKADCIRFKPHSSVTPKYMNAALNSEPIRKRTKGKVHGVGRPRLNLGEIKSIVLPVPPLVEQTRIVAEVERRLSVVEELEAVVSANLQRATRLRQSVLQKAFTGEPCAPEAAAKKEHSL